MLHYWNSTGLSPCMVQSKYQFLGFLSCSPWSQSSEGGAVNESRPVGVGGAEQAREPSPLSHFLGKNLKKKTTTLPSKILNSPFGFKKYFVRANFFSHPLTFKLVPTSLRAFTSLQYVSDWYPGQSIGCPSGQSISYSSQPVGERTWDQGIPVGRGEEGGEGALKGNLGRPAFTLFETKIVHFTSLFKSGCTSFHDHDSKKNTLRKSRKIT